MCSLDGRSRTDTDAIPGRVKQASLEGALYWAMFATRGLRRPSPGLLARLGVPVGGRVRKLRAVGDQSDLIPLSQTLPEKLNVSVFRPPVTKSGQHAIRADSPPRHLHKQRASSAMLDFKTKPHRGAGISLANTYLTPAEH